MLALEQVVNLDDPNASFFLSRGNPAVPAITYALENEAADVHALEVSLSLFETELILRTPHVREHLFPGSPLAQESPCSGLSGP